MENKFFMHQIKRTGGTIDKGIVVKDTYEGAKQSYHAYLGPMPTARARTLILCRA